MSSAVSSSSGSAASSASALITSTGIGSGLNINAIVSSLTSAYGAAQQNEITAQQTTLNAQVSAFGTFSSALSTLQATLSTLENPGTLAGFSATVGATSVASATADSSAVAGQYELGVSNLATAATLTSGPLASADTSIGTGSLTITVGNASATVNINSSDDTLAGIAQAINNASNNPGVNASVLTTTAGSRLVLSGTSTGAANAISVTESDGGTGLSPLVSTLAVTQPATDANFTINGYPATSADNVVTAAISGVTLNLTGTTAAGTPTTLTIAPDTSAAQASISTFVSAVNGVLSSIQSLTGYNATTQTAGPLNGNATLQAFQNQLENILDTVTVGGTSGIHSLSDLGITPDAQTGTLDSNSTTLATQLSANLAGVGALLGGTDGIATKINSLVNSYTGPAGLLTSVTQGLQSSLTNVSNQQTLLNQELAAYSATLTTEYNAMDTAVAALKETQTYLNAEFNPSSSSSSSSSSSTSSLGSGSLST
jgi:flagellar hook-associated protein 2